MFKKILALVLGLVPFGVLAEQVPGTPGYLIGSGIPGVAPSGVVVGGDCYINGGVLSCSGVNEDFVNAGNIEPGKPGIHGDLSFAGYGGSAANGFLDAFDPINSVNIVGSLKNENWLVLAPGSATDITAADGTIYIGGYVYNGTLDGSTFDDAPSVGVAAVSNSRLVMEGSSVTINGSDANGVAVLNVGERAIAGNQIQIAPGEYAHSSVTAADSLSIQSNSGSLVVNGHIWNNSADGITGRVSGTNADLVRFGAVSAQNITVNGNVVNFGGWANFTAGTDLEILGNIISGHGTMALSTTNGIIYVGDISLTGDATNISLTQRGSLAGHNGIYMGALNIASGYGTFTADTFITVNGDINISSAGVSNGTSFWAKNGAFIAGNITNAATAGNFSIIATNGITAGAISNSAGIMSLNAGSGTARNLIADSITSNVGGTIVLDYVGDFLLTNTTASLTVGGSLYVGDTTGVNGNNGDMYFTANSGVYNSVTGLIENVITARGAVNIAGNVVINNGRGLYIAPPSTDYINITMGNVINNSGGLFIGSEASMAPASGYGVRSFASGAVTVNGTVTNRSNTAIYVTDDGSGNNNISMGVVQNGFYSDMYLRADDNITMTSFSNMEQTSGDVTIWAQNGNITMTGGVNSGFLENMARGTAKMIVRADNGAITTAGDIENSGTFLQLLAKDGITVGGTIKNDLTDGMGTLLIGTDGVFDSQGNLATGNAVANLTINGGDASNASLVNTGVFKAVVSGQTYLNHGIDMTLVPDSGTFYLDTGTFVIANPAGTNGINDLMKNRISNFTLKIRNGDLDLTDVINGAKKLPVMNAGVWDYSDPGILANSGANMYVSAKNLKATSVTNIGTKLTLVSDDTSALTGGKRGHLWITSNVLNGTADGSNPINNGVNAVTTLQSAGVLAIDGFVNNFATLYINGEMRTILNAVINSGKTYITSRTDLGIIDIDGNINNRGAGATGTSYWATGTAYDLFINAKEVNLNGDMTSESGTTLIKASDGGAVQVDMKNLFVNGGQVDIDALMGIILSGTMDVNSGLLNFSQNTRSVVSNGNIEIGGNLNARDTYDLTSGSINVLSTNMVMESSGNINVGGSILAQNSGAARNLTLKANAIDVGADVTAEGTGVITFGDNVALNGFVDTLDVVGKMWAKSGARIILNATNVTVGTLENNGRMDANGIGIIADAVMTGNAINLTNGVYFDNVNRTAQTTGFIIGAAGKEFSLLTTGAGADINIAGGISVNDSNILHITSADRLLIAGNVTNSGGTLDLTATGDVALTGNITSGSTTNIVGNGIVGQDITNSGDFNITSTGGAIQFNNITNNAGAVMNLGNSGYPLVNITTASFTQNGGVTNVYGAGWVVTNALNLNAGAVNLYTDRLTADSIYVENDLVQDSASGVLDGNLNVTVNNTIITADSLNVDGNLNARTQTAIYDIADNVTIGEKLILGSGADVTLTSADGDIVINGTNVGTGNDAISNSGNLLLHTDSSSGKIIVSAGHGVTNTATGNMTVFGDDVTLGYIHNYGTMLIDSGTTKMLQLSGLDTYSGTITLIGAGVRSSGAFNIAGALNQNAGFGGNGDVDISANNYIIDLTNNGSVPNSIEIANGIMQGSGELTIKTSSLLILSGGINAASGDGITIAGGNNCFGSGCTPPSGIGSGDWFPWLDANITGDISDGVKFRGIGNMTLNGNYLFSDNSFLQASVLPKNFDPNHNHYGTIGLDSISYGQVDMAGATPIIDISGRFISDLSSVPDLPNGGVSLQDGQFGISIFDSVDSGTVIWLAHAAGGVESSGEKLRNITVGFCNANGTKCFNYIDAIRDANGLLVSKSPLVGSDSDDDLPIYIMLRKGENETDNPDNIYIVFNPEFGGPINVYKIQPEVDKDPKRTDNEYGTAGAIDDLVEGMLHKDGFFFTTPIEVIPLVFGGTNFETIGQELYKRMEQYKLDYDPTGLARFSRLFVPRELELIAGDISLIEHSASRSLANRMTDEFLWNRNRNLKKVWADFEVGLYNQNLTDDLEADGNKFTLNVGFDWRATDVTIVGFAGRINHLNSSVSDSIDLSYKKDTPSNPRIPIPGHVDIDVTTTNIGLGAYLLTTFSREMRLYGNLFLDMHMLDVAREQNFIGPIEGSGTAYSITSEWGLLHDLQNQYFIGNLYLRLGYNTGFDITENASGGNYMKLQSDGYFMLTPGYSVTMNKALYTSPWAKIRPYLTVGIEYDVIGMNDVSLYKFAPSEGYTNYDLEISPIWAYGQVGVEFMAVSGWQVGLSYEYKFNPEITLHNFKLSGSYRF